MGLSPHLFNEQGNEGLGSWSDLQKGSHQDREDSGVELRFSWFQSCAFSKTLSCFFNLRIKSLGFGISNSRIWGLRVLVFWGSTLPWLRAVGVWVTCFQSGYSVWQGSATSLPYIPTLCLLKSMLWPHTVVWGFPGGEGQVSTGGQ